MTKDQLSDKSGAFLMCSEEGPLHGEFSANVHDYWWMDARDDFVCAECGAEQLEMVRVSRLVTV